MVMKNVSRRAPYGFCAIDFELWCDDPASACAVAIARVRDGEVVRAFYSQIKPPDGMFLDSGYMATPGFVANDAIFAPTFAELWPSMRDFIGDDYLVSRNSRFNLDVLRSCIRRYGLEYSVPRFDDADPERYGTDPFARYFSREVSPHEAMGEALASAKAYLEAAVWRESWSSLVNMAMG